MKLKLSYFIKIKKSLIHLLLLNLILLSCQSCYKEAEKKTEKDIFRKTQLLMGTYIEISLQHPDQDLSRLAMKQAFEEISRIESLMSLFKPDSELSQINQLAIDKSQKTSQEIIDLLQISRQAWQLTDGGFDPTASPIIKLWGFYKHKGNLPSSKEIEERLKLVDFQKVKFDAEKEEVHFLIPGIKLDFNAIAKGYAVDRAAKVLKAAGIKRALINAGGDIYVLGRKNSQENWNIGIRDPKNTSKIIASIQLKDKAIVTSGSYENFFLIAGKRYCHIINPLNGYPVQGVLSVTVIANQTALADALATGIFILGKDKGLKLLNSLEDIEGIIITENNEVSNGMKIYPSTKLKKKLKFLNKPN